MTIETSDICSPVSATCVTYQGQFDIILSQRVVGQVTLMIAVIPFQRAQDSLNGNLLLGLGNRFYVDDVLMTWL